MRTGCQPPYCHGTGGFCGCNCKCCPPPCCPVISVYFQCCAPPGFASSPPSPLAAWDTLPLSLAVNEELPNFNSKPIFSEDKRFVLGFGSIPASCPCETVCVQIQCGGFGLPCCCLELLDGVIYAVGNGYVTGPTTVSVPGCGEATVLINGLPAPVFVNDCEIITVTIQVTDPEECCNNECFEIEAVCAPCASSMAMTKPLWKRKIDPRTGKTKINPTTGRPIVVIDKAELRKRVLNKIKTSKRRGKK